MHFIYKWLKKCRFLAFLRGELQVSFVVLILLQAVGDVLFDVLRDARKRLLVL
jgi:hypothetical protein